MLLFIYCRIKFRLRFMPSNLLLLSGEFLKMVLKDSSVNSSQSFFVKFKTWGRGAKAISSVGPENLFQGHTSWHTSQPNIQLSNLPFISPGINASFNSMVK